MKIRGKWWRLQALNPPGALQEVDRRQEDRQIRREDRKAVHAGDERQWKETQHPHGRLRLYPGGAKAEVKSWEIRQVHDHDSVGVDA
jgi:hypothetical protein